MARNIGATLSLKEGNFFTNIKRASTETEGFGKRLGVGTNKISLFGKELSRTNNPLTALTKGIVGFVSAYAGLEAIKGIGSLSDEMASTHARLNAINDGLQTNSELNKMIYQSAKDSRGVYKTTADLVIKLGNNCGTVFKSTKETVAFAEQLNKRFVLAGAGANEANSAITQLSQGLAAGALRGEELNSVLENAPNIARTIESYMGIAQGSIKQAAEKGLVTADVVKNAILSTADETNASFSKMPLTFGQIWQNIKTTGLQSFEPILTKINELANSEQFQNLVTKFTKSIEDLSTSGAMDTFINGMVTGLTKGLDALTYLTENWDTIGPIIKGVGAAFIVASVGVGIFNAVMMMSPVSWIILGIGALIGVFVGLYAKCEWFRNGWDAIWGAIKAVASAAWYKIKAIWEGVGLFFGNVWNAAKDTVTEKLGNMKSAYEEHGGGFKGVFFAAVEGVKGYYSAGFTFIDNLTGGKLTAIKDKIVNAFKTVKTKVTDIFTSIKDKIKEIWDKIKGFIKTPSIVQTGTVTFAGINTPIPKFGIEWHANGGIMRRPTAFAYSGVTAHVGGEAGAEAILPLSQFWNNLERYTRANRGESHITNNYVNITVNSENSDDERTARVLAKEIKKVLSNM